MFYFQYIDSNNDTGSQKETSQVSFGHKQESSQLKRQNIEPSSGSTQPKRVHTEETVVKPTKNLDQKPESALKEIISGKDIESHETFSSVQTKEKDPSEFFSRVSIV